MHKLIFFITLSAAIMLATSIPGRSYTFQHTDASASTRIKWSTSTRPIQIALSPSLATPPANIKAGSDVYAAARRALARWSEVANIRFVEVQTNEQSISASGNPDGISLITIANTAQNAGAFPVGADVPGLTRVFFDPTNGTISEADIVINPTLFAGGNNPKFSTDGTSGTYDLEAVLMHEIGHLLGLDHSGVIGATMQPLLGVNNLYGVQAFTVRTLSEDDASAARTLYSLRSNTGAISGTVTYANGTPAYGAHVWAEDVLTGKVVAGNVAFSTGAYRIDDLLAGEYRVLVEYLDGPVAASDFISRAYAGLSSAQPFRSVEATNRISVATGGTSLLPVTLPSGARSMNAQLIGLNGTLSTSAVPLSPGGPYTIYVGGQGVDQISGSGLSVHSPFITINQASFQSLAGFGLPVISFEITVNGDVPSGDYTIRLQSNTNEVAYLAGGLTIEANASVQFAAASGGVAEDAGRASLLITRSGDSSAAASVNYSTVDATEFIGCDIVNGVALPRCDYVTAVDTITFAAGETQKTIQVPIIDDGYAEGAETLRLSLANASGTSLGAQSSMVLTITDNDAAGTPNPIIGSNPFFVRQQYLDFLSREPEPAGFDSWLGVLNGCTTNAPSCDRVEVSASFFSSAEFQGKGYFFYRFYTASFGARPTATRPTFAEFDRDMKLFSARTDLEVEPKRQEFIADFIARPEWTARYSGLSNASYVDTLLQTAGVPLLASRNQLVNDLEAGTRTRGQVLRAIVESAEVTTREYNRAFVALQYFGYLRRDPEAQGYAAWLRVIDADPANYRQMVDGFANSVEYRKRFGQT